MEMSVFPRISLKPEVTNFLQSVFLNKEVRISVFFSFLFLNDHKPLFYITKPDLSRSFSIRQVMGRQLNRISLSALLLFQVLAAVGHQEADSHFQKLLTCLSHPPSYTCVRASTHLAPLEEIRLKLAEELTKVKSFERFFCCRDDRPCPVQPER